MTSEQNSERQKMYSWTELNNRLWLMEKTTPEVLHAEFDLAVISIHGRTFSRAGAMKLICDRTSGSAGWKVVVEASGTYYNSTVDLNCMFGPTRMFATTTGYEPVAISEVFVMIRQCNGQLHTWARITCYGHVWVYPFLDYELACVSYVKHLTSSRHVVLTNYHVRNGMQPLLESLEAPAFSFGTSTGQLPSLTNVVVTDEVDDDFLLRLQRKAPKATLEVRAKVEEAAETSPKRGREPSSDPDATEPTAKQPCVAAETPAS